MDENNNSLSFNQRLIAKDISERTKLNCIRYTHEQGSDKKISGDMKITQSVDIKRMYDSSVGWYKAYIMSQGVWDNICYNPDRFLLICGDKQWSQYQDSLNIQFFEIGVQFNSVKSPLISKEEKPELRDIKSIEQRLRVLKDLRQKDLITEQQYNEQVYKLLQER